MHNLRRQEIISKMYLEMIQKGKVGALTLLSNSVKDAMAGGWSSDAVAIEALTGR
jgi:hypothetical protein